MRPSIRMSARLRRFAAAAVLTSVAGLAPAVTVTSVSPQGEVAEVRQVTLKFSDAVVPFGDLRLPDPMTVTCTGAGGSGAGAGRWANDRVWLYDFRAPLPPGTRCALRLRSEWKPSGPTPLTGVADAYRFSTGGPAVASVAPWDGSQIAEDQYFLLRLTGAAVESTVLANAGCEVDGIGERIGVRIIAGAERSALLKARHVDIGDGNNNKTPADHLLVLACQRPLPNDVAMRLIWGAGIAAAIDPQVLTRVEQRWRFQVRPAFSADFSCERERANAPCLPIRPMRVQFSSPVARELAAQVRLKAASGESFAPVFDKDDDKAASVNRLSLPTPLPENTRFSLEMPRELRDDAGRTLANAGSFPLPVATGDAPPIAKFAAAPFGIVELNGAGEGDSAVLPVTLRHVQGDLRPAAPSGQVRVKTLRSDAEILAWFEKVQRYDARELTGKALGLPETDWYTWVDDTDRKGRKTRRRIEREFPTRERSLLEGDASARRLAMPQLVGGDPRPFEVVGIPLPGPGYQVVEIESLRLGQSLLDKRAPMFVRTGVLVTDLGVHFKLGRESSLVWVTSLDRGKPVEGAAVVVNDCRGKPLWSGLTDAQGLARIGQALAADRARCLVDEGYFVTARKADAAGRMDTAFVFSGWQKGIESWRFDLPTASGANPDARAATVLDRTLFRAGETVSMKHFFRFETSAGLTNAGPGELPTRLKIVHQGSGQEFIVGPLDWSGGSRSALSTWNIPPAAKLGVYQLLLEREAAGGRRLAQWPSGDFRVEEFRLPLVDARVSGPKAVPVAPKELPIALQLNYFSGGAMAQAPARASAVLKSRPVSFAGYDDFSFEPPREPVKAQGSAQARNGDEDEENEVETSANDSKLIADKLPLTTDRNGAAGFTLKELPAITRPSQIDAEVSFNDPNGETQTVATAVPLWPSAVVLGVKTGSWASSRGKVKFSVLALDTTGRAIKGQRVDVRGRLSRVISNRKRMVGGFYAYDNRTEVQDLGALCSGRSNDRGLLLCEAELNTAGQVELIASAQDAAGNPVQAAASVWVTKRGELWFGQSNDDRIDVLPEKKHYEPGETARLQVRMPFREATALVSVEREGVIDSRVVTLSGDDPTIEVPIGKTWAPNVYVSVLALRGRLREVPWYSFFTWGWKEPLAWARSFWYEGREYQAPTAMVDLSKPAFKFGVAALQVGVAAHRLQVTVAAGKPQYSVRQKATARIKVLFDGKPLAGTEVAFAAVDEGLLALRDNDSWNLLDLMIRQRAWGVETSTAQSEIIGRRHYGRKAVAAGGGGGHGGSRELFDTLLLWRPNVSLDGNGEALVEVPLNDSLTSFRFVAIADQTDAAGGQRFGTGSTSVRVTQDLQLLAGLPPLVREGDHYSAMLTLRNTTAREMKVHATLAGVANRADVAALPAAGSTIERTLLAPLPAQDVTVAAGAARELLWPVDVPAGAFSIAWEADAEEQAGGASVSGSQAGSANAGGARTAGDPRASDRLKITQQVSPAVPIRVLQATLQQLDGNATLAVAAPVDALPDTGIKRGGINVGVQPKLSGALPGMRRFFETYPFACLEQKVSKAVGLKDAKLWAGVANTLPTYLDGDGLASYFPPRAEDGAHGSDRLTAYLISATQEAGFELPAPAREAMLDGLSAFVDGRIERKSWSPKPDLDVRKLAALDAMSRYGRAQAKQLGSINLTPNLWPTAALIDWLGVLRRVDAIPDRAKRLEEANQILRSRLTYAGTTLRFSNEADDFWWWLMDSADANAARLILAVLDDPAWRDDLPRMVVGSLARQRRGAWLTTTANLWGSLALDKFAAKFESLPVAGRTSASLGEGTGIAIDWGRQPGGGTLHLAWPGGATASGNLSVVQEGSGKPWLSIQSLAAVPLKAPISAGYRILRSTSAVERRDASTWSRGDIVRIRIEVEAQADMTWVVVSDPVPAGATILGSGLGRDSSLATAKEKRSRSAWPAYEERGFEAFRSYYEYLPRGQHVIEYTVQLNNPGRFSLPPTRVEAMYAPESFGESPNAPVEVGP